MRLTAKPLLLCAALALSACGAAEPIWAPDADVARQTYRHDGPTSLTLYTVINNRSGSGGHSALMVNAPSQRVMFDPAGTFYHPHLPERNDVHYGMSDTAVDVYIDYHARITWHVVEHELEVSPQTAALILAKVQSHGAVPKAQCAASISDILQSVPEFADAPNTQFPKKLMAWFSALDGVEEQKFYDDSPENNKEPVQVPALWLDQ